MAIPLLLAGAAIAGAAAGAGDKAEGAGRVKRVAGTFYDPTGQRQTGYDANASYWGGRPGALQDNSANLNYRRVMTEDRGANTANYWRAHDYDVVSGQARQQQAGMADAMRARALGQTPSIAGAQSAADIAALQRGAATNIGAMQQGAALQNRDIVATQGAQAASARGAAGVALAGQTSANNIANQQGMVGRQTALGTQNIAQGVTDQTANIAQQAQVNAMRERESAEQNAFGAYSGIRGGDVASQQQAAQQAQFQALQEQSARNANDTRAMQYEQMDQNAYGAQLGAQMQNQAILAGSYNNSEQLNSRQAMYNADKDKSWSSSIFGGALQGVGAVGGMGGGGSSPSDVRAKEPISLSRGGGRYMVSDDRAKLAEAWHEGRSAAVQEFQRPSRGPTPPNPYGDEDDDEDDLSPTPEELDQLHADTKAEYQRYRSQGLPAPPVESYAPEGYVAPPISSSLPPPKPPPIAAPALAPGGRAATMGVMRPPPQRIRARAEGGPVEAGQTYLVGERGPELVVPRRDGHVIRNEDIPFTMTDAIDAKQREGRRDPKTFSVDSPEKQRAVKRAYEDKAGREADAIMAGLQRSLAEGPSARRLASGTPETDYETELTSGAEAAFRRKYGDADTSDYDLRGAHAEGVTDRQPYVLDADSNGVSFPGHLPDTYKKPSHETFSEESQYARFGRPGRWDGDRFIAPDRGPIAESNRSLVSSPYAYREEFTPPEQEPGEPNVGPMAQNMERSEVAGTAVKQTPDGLKLVDESKLTKVNSAGISDLQRQVDELRLVLARGGRR